MGAVRVVVGQWPIGAEVASPSGRAGTVSTPRGSRTKPHKVHKAVHLLTELKELTRTSAQFFLGARDCAGGGGQRGANWQRSRHILPLGKVPESDNCSRRGVFVLSTHPDLDLI